MPEYQDITSPSNENSDALSYGEHLKVPSKEKVCCTSSLISMNDWCALAQPLLVFQHQGGSHWYIQGSPWDEFRSDPRGKGSHTCFWNMWQAPLFHYLQNTDGRNLGCWRHSSKVSQPWNMMECALMQSAGISPGCNWNHCHCSIIRQGWLDGSLALFLALHIIILKVLLASSKQSNSRILCSCPGYPSVNPGPSIDPHDL